MKEELKEEEKEYISLGKDCCMAYHLQRLGKKKQTYPFDWLLIKDVDTIYTLIENDFVDFLNPNYLQYKNNVRDSFLVDDKIGNDEIENNDKIEHDVSLIRVTNTKYKIHFLHDFECQNDLNELQKVTKKYERRINRFYKVMRDENVPKSLFHLSSTTTDLKKLNFLFISKGFNNFTIHLIYSSIPTASWKRKEWSQLIENTIYGIYERIVKI